MEILFITAIGLFAYALPVIIIVAFWRKLAQIARHGEETVELLRVIAEQDAR